MEVECLICQKIAGQYTRIQNRHIERHQNSKSHQRAIACIKSSRSISLTVPTIDGNENVTDDTCFADAPVDSAMLEEVRSDIPAPSFCNESQPGGSDDESLVPLHLLWDPSKSAVLSSDFEFSYDSSIDLHELEDDGDEGVHDGDHKEMDQIDVSGG
jgi:hypothetical protein